MADSSATPNQPISNVSSSGSVFVGRLREMAQLKAALDDALSGRGQMVMLVGEPGIGKTRTAQELAALAEEQGAKVLWGWCNEEGSPFLALPPFCSSPSRLRPL